MVDSTLSHTILKKDLVCDAVTFEIFRHVISLSPRHRRYHNNGILKSLSSQILIS